MECPYKLRHHLITSRFNKWFSWQSIKTHQFEWSWWHVYLTPCLIENDIASLFVVGKFQRFSFKRDAIDVNVLFSFLHRNSIACHLLLTLVYVFVLNKNMLNVTFVVHLHLCYAQKKNSLHTTPAENCNILLYLCWWDLSIL